MDPHSAVAGNGFLSGEDQLVNVLGPGIPEDLHLDHFLSVRLLYIIATFPLLVKTFFVKFL